jgi:sulfide:quinone oxidoreductase
MKVLIAGGGVAGLEALLALRAIAGDRVDITLVAPDPDFTYRPLAVTAPFALGRAQRVSLRTLADETGAELVEDAVTAVDDATREVRLRDIEEGYTKRVAMIVPPGSVWPLPAYELALMTAGEARAMGQDDIEVTVVTPEHEPLSLFGQEASAAVAEELGAAGVRLKTGVVARVEPGGLALEPTDEHLSVQRAVAVPRIVGPAIDGLPCDDEGFIEAHDDARVQGCERTWAAGDGVVSPVKFGGLATHQARRAAAAIARVAGAEEAPDPGEPALVGRLMVGKRTRRLIRRADVDTASLWWPAGKVAGEYLPRWLAEHGVAPAAAHEPPAGGVGVRRPLSTLRGAEAQYLYDLARQFRTDDPEIAALGRRMRAVHEH